jgi:DNA-binding MarR family transcriptional regulator
MNTQSSSGMINISPTEFNGQLSLSNGSETKNSINKNTEEQYSEVLLKCFNPTTILRNIKELLSRIGIKYVFICLDDFSEIDERAMKVFVNTIVSPLNNWSDEYLKFKIAAYPGRLYLGDIDPQKIEQIKLDYFDLYQARKVTDIQTEAQKSIKRLLTTRIKYFCNKNPELFFDLTKNSMDEYYKALFEITSSVPRNVGWILWYAYQSSISKDQKINIRDLDIAAERYFSDSINPYFSQNKFMREPFSVKLEKYHLKELLDSIVELAKQNKREIGQSDSKIFQLDKLKPPTSHFYIDKELEELIFSLELHFFITKYNEQKDQDSQKVMSFFSLNYGLCSYEDIFYGRGGDRKYVIQRRFNYSSAIRKYLETAKQLRCNNTECGETYQYELLDKIRLFDILCPKCKRGTCSIEHVTVDIPIADEQIQIVRFDMDLLNSLKIEEPQYASSLAQELDCTYQKVSKRSIKLKELGLIESERKTIDTNIGERTYYRLTQKAIKTYFEYDNNGKQTKIISEVH